MDYAIPNNIKLTILSEDEIVIFNNDIGQFYGVEGPLAKLLEGLKKGLNIENIKVGLLNEYNVSEEDLEEEVGNFLVMLLEKGVIIGGWTNE